jgi:hypothetical protein
MLAYAEQNLEWYTDFSELTGRTLQKNHFMTDSLARKE